MATTLVKTQRIVRDRAGVSEGAGAALQILIAEHWSLLSTRSLTYSESLTRVIIFLSVLSVAFVGLALLAQVDHFGHVFTLAAIPILAIVVFVGVATVVRLSALNVEDFRSVMGMNRLRRAYLELHSELEPYFVTSSYDDLAGVMLTVDMHMHPGGWRMGDVGHGLETLPAMLGLIVGVVAGVLGAIIAATLGTSTLVILSGGIAIFVGTASVLGLSARHAFSDFVARMPSRFPSQPSVSCASDGPHARARARGPARPFRGFPSAGRLGGRVHSATKPARIDQPLAAATSRS